MSVIDILIGTRTHKEKMEKVKESTRRTQDIGKDAAEALSMIRAKVDADLIAKEAEERRAAHAAGG